MYKFISSFQYFFHFAMQLIKIRIYIMIRKQCLVHDQSIYTYCLHSSCSDNRFVCSQCIIQRHSKHSDTHIIKLHENQFKSLQQKTQLANQIKQSVMYNILSIKKAKLQILRTLQKQLQIFDNNLTQRITFLQQFQQLFLNQFGQSAYKIVIQNKQISKINKISLKMSLLNKDNFKSKKRECLNILEEIKSKITPALSKINQKFRNIYLNNQQIQSEAKKNMMQQHHISQITQKIYVKNKIIDINSVIENVYRINLQSCQLYEIPKEIAKCQILTEVMLRNNHIKQINHLSNLSNLNLLDLRKNAINHISGLNELSNLKRLLLSSNSISSIDGLDYLTKLKYLDLSSNQIKKIKNLEALTELAYLDLSKNQIGCAEGLSNLTKLQKLLLHKNDITTYDLSLFSEFIKTNHLKELSVYKNPCCLHLLDNDTLQRLAQTTKIYLIDNEQIMNHPDKK